VILETIALSIFNFDSAVAAAASRMRQAAGPHFLLEAGSRRVAELAAPAAARAAYIGGADATSNLEAGFRYGIPVVGTTAHAFILAHADERAAFAAQRDRLGPTSTYLVDTYDTSDGIRNAIDATAARLGQIRIDSGDLAVEAAAARALLDDAGAHDARIMVSGDLDEHRIAELVDGGAPIDGFESGNRLVTGSGQPTAGFVYKLVAIADEPGHQAPLRPVAKRAHGKTNVAGRKHAWRELDADGRARRERISTDRVPITADDTPTLRALQVPLVRGGVRTGSTTAQDARARHVAALAELRPEHLDIRPGPPALEVVRTAADRRT
jgi:nicotinate phosphoribosyltransferase